ncbi:MAG: ABC transporter ATP-binding protein [Bacteroidales bacterium]|nr:ABC transporter ATP-binding protein [Bacteroidales bacterium]MDY2692297.1 ABC transporter ATP-binding protein [Prevotella sp.]MDD5788752.1 ABC transporter ATP-binding protein [Bacteroidales bacterium]MDD6898225.1 ABC transporter ATP-binding protein [Bacteroidales bacterium]MDY4732195.1 ABC transporter ATP-binding protein [Prevotella sp.]
MIDIKDLKYKYAGSRRYVFSDFNLSMESNNIYGLLGKNGMGKSTLLYLISGLLRRNGGTISINGLDTINNRAEMLSEIFLVPEEFDLLPMSLEAYVKMNKPFYPNFSREVLESCLRDFELTPDINLKELSMGQKKKVYMSFALAANTKLLLMDEPTNGLDIPSKSQFRRVIANNMDEGRTMIISTHQVHDVESLLDHILILDHSELLLNASVSDICSKYSFGYRQVGEPTDDVLYAEPSVQGSAVITRKQTEEEETQLNLELLFDAVTQKALTF